MEYTTLPFMDVEELFGAREGWYRLGCTLCDFNTGSGAFKTVEWDAAEHLSDVHDVHRRRSP